MPTGTSPSGKVQSSAVNGTGPVVDDVQSQDVSSEPAAAAAPDAGTEAPLGAVAAPVAPPTPDAGTEAPLGGGVVTVGDD